jgi:hypothetical protein
MFVRGKGEEGRCAVDQNDISHYSPLEKRVDDD